MRKLLILPVFPLTAAVVWACGDKLMLVMRIRLAQLKPSQPVAILAYAQRDLPSSALIRQIQLQPAVKKAGHKFEFIEDTAKLAEALRVGKYDLFLADLSIAAELSEHVRSSPFQPAVLPVAYKSTKAEDSAAQKKFHCLLRTPSGSEQYFEAIDQALQWKAKSAGR